MIDRQDALEQRARLIVSGTLREDFLRLLECLLGSIQVSEMNARDAQAQLDETAFRRGLDLSLPQADQRLERFALSENALERGAESLSPQLEASSSSRKSPHAPPETGGWLRLPKTTAR